GSNTSYAAPERGQGNGSGLLVERACRIAPVAVSRLLGPAHRLGDWRPGNNYKSRGRSSMRARVPLLPAEPRLGVPTMRCPCCHARIIWGRATSGLRIDYQPGGVVIYDRDRPIHSCVLERAVRAEPR